MFEATISVVRCRQVNGQEVYVAMYAYGWRDKRPPNPIFSVSAMMDSTEELPALREQTKQKCLEFGINPDRVINLN